jgi:exopolysaccharide biosynthesis polyprenyl glycosylphosphotransferase
MATREINSELVDREGSTCIQDAIPVEQASGWSELLSRSAMKQGLYLLGDLLAILVAHLIAKAGVQRLLHIPSEYLAPALYYLLYLPFFAAVLYLFNAYRTHDLRRPEKELELVCKAATFSFLALIAASVVVFKTGFSRYFFMAWYLVSLPLLLATRFGLRAIYGVLWEKGLAQQRAVLVGAPHESAEFQEILSLQRHRGYQIVGLLLAPSSKNLDSEVTQQVPVLGRAEQWEEVTSECSVDLIVICSAPMSHQLALQMLPGCCSRNIEVEVYSGLFGVEELQYELDEFSGFLRFRAKPRWVRRIQFLLKALLDRIVGAVGSIVTVLLVPVVGSLIKLEDGGPVFYRSPFLGQDGTVHYYLKFRSMCVDADQVLASSTSLRKRFQRKYKLEKDPRVTRVGRFLRKYSVDEFPQFFSVLLGQLSFVGPRTIREEEGLRYGPLLPKLLTFKPGVTGFWQVMGRQTTSYDERIQMDMFYIDHWSVWLDLVIMAKTGWKSVKAEGAY